VVTIARSGQNINGGTASLTLGAGSATAPISTRIVSDGTNYFANAIAGAGGGGSITGSGLTSGNVYYYISNALYPASAYYLSATATFTGSSAIVAATNTFFAGVPIQFSNSGGALPTGVSAATTYYVVSTGLSGSQFEFSATPGGS